MLRRNGVPIAHARVVTANPCPYKGPYNQFSSLAVSVELFPCAISRKEHGGYLAAYKLCAPRSRPATTRSPRCGAKKKSGEAKPLKASRPPPQPPDVPTCDRDDAGFASYPQHCPYRVAYAGGCCGCRNDVPPGGLLVLGKNLPSNFTSTNSLLASLSPSPFPKVGGTYPSGQNAAEVAGPLWDRVALGSTGFQRLVFNDNGAIDFADPQNETRRMSTRLQEKLAQVALNMETNSVLVGHPVLATCPHRTSTSAFRAGGGRRYSPPACALEVHLSQPSFFIVFLGQAR